MAYEGEGLDWLSETGRRLLTTTRVVVPFVGAGISNQIALVDEGRGNGGQGRAAAIELLNELGLDARHRLAVVRSEAAALEQRAPGGGEKRRGNACQGDQQVGLADSRPDDHA